MTNPVWLQSKPLTLVDKIRTYVQLPIFAYAPDWKGYSELVTQFNFSASKNFYLKNRPAKPSGVDYLLCIKYRVGQTVYRYKLWQHAGATGMDEVPLYMSQVIKKNFVLEVWSTGVTATQTEAINIITSVVQIPTDISNLADVAFATGTEFNDYNPVAQASIDLPATVLHSFGYYRWQPSGINDALFNNTCSSWTNDGSLPAATLNPLAANPAIVAGPNGYNAVRYPNLQATIAGNINYCLLMVVKMNAWVANDKLLQIFVNAATAKNYLYCGPGNIPQVEGVAVNTVGALHITGATEELPQGEWALLRFRCSSATKEIFLSVNGSAELSTVVAGTLGTFDRILLDENAALFDVAEIILYNGSGGTGAEDKSAITQAESYLLQKYALGLVAEPIVFDPRTIWLDNV